MSRAWAVVSGKGGAGKSVLTAGLAAGIGTRMECCCLDTVSGLRDLDMLLGLQSLVVFDAADAAENRCSMEDALLSDPQLPGVVLMPAPQNHTMLSESQLFTLIRKLKQRYAYVLLDTPSGIGDSLDQILRAVDGILLVTTPDDISMRNAERVTSHIRDMNLPAPLLVVNRVIPSMVASGRVCDPRTLAIELDIPLLGFIPQDNRISSGENNFLYQKSQAGTALMRIASRFLGENVKMPDPRRSRVRGLPPPIEKKEEQSLSWL